MIAVTLATAGDFRRFYKENPPEVWTALVGRENGRIVGMGGCIWDEWGRAFGFFDALVRPSVTVHRQAKRFLAAMCEAGEPAIYTTCDSRIPNAEKWLERLGFVRVPDSDATDDVWCLVLSKTSNDSGIISTPHPVNDPPDGSLGHG